MRVVCGIPAGRTRFMRILFPYLLQQTGVDAFEIWENTNNAEDQAFMHDFAKTHPKFSVMPLPFGGYDGSGSVRHVMRFCNDPDTLYVRCDDDICWMDPECLATLISFRQQYPEYFLVYANIVNNNIGSYIHQRLGAMTRNTSTLAYASMCAASMTNPDVACEAHDCFRKHYENNTLEVYKFDQWIDWDCTRICVNLISWFGRDMPQDGRDFVDKNEEMEMSVRIPKERGLNKAICGNALAVHYSYGTQLHGVPDSYLDWYTAQAGVQTGAIA